MKHGWTKKDAENEETVARTSSRRHSFSSKNGDPPGPGLISLDPEWPRPLSDSNPEARTDPPLRGYGCPLAVEWPLRLIDRARPGRMPAWF